MGKALKKDGDAPTIYVTPNGSRYVKPSEALSHPKVKKIINSVAEAPISSKHKVVKDK